MAAGTLSVTNNSKAVVGVGTTFTTFKAGDFLTLVVGQVPYTVAIASIESETALTLVLPFDGPTATGLAWDGIKRDTMSLATMGVTVQAQKALRLMIADENNWRAIFGDEEEVTVTLPNGQVMQGMSWGYLSQLMKQIDLVEMRNLQQQAAASEAAAQGFRNEAEGFKTETAGIRDATNQIKADTQAIHDATNTIKTQTNTIKTQTDRIKTDTRAIKGQTDQIKTDTGVIRDEANAAKAEAQSARDAALGYRNEAEQFKNEIGSSNFLAKDGNLAGLTDLSESRDNLGLGALATKDSAALNSTDTTGILPLAKGGLGAGTLPGARETMNISGRDSMFGTVNNILTYFNNIANNGGLFAFRDGADDATHTYKFGSAILFRTTDTYGLLSVDHNNGNVRVAGGIVSGGIAATGYINNLWGTRNTTVDSNGFIKTASPIVKIYSDGVAETNDEAEGVTVTRISAGVYVVEGCLGLNSDPSWGGPDGGIEIPTDVNKQPRLWVGYRVRADGAVEVRTYHRTHPHAPAFARNEIEGVADGDPIDIPQGTFISVRVNMPE